MSLEKTNTKIESFRDLRIWQESMELVQQIYKVTIDFPNHETYGLISQLRRASVSIPSNIAEGFRRQYSKEYKQFLSVALGSCGELETQIEIAQKLGYLTAETAKNLIDRIEAICKMTQTLMKRLF